MTAEPFNAGWSYRHPLGSFAVAQGPTPTPTPVTLPHDALRDAERSPDVPGKGAGGYYPPGAYTYLKTFDAPADWVAKTVSLGPGPITVTVTAAGLEPVTVPLEVE